MVTVAVTTQPTYRVGPKTGFKAQGTIQAQDLECKDDLLVQGDAEVVGTLYVGTLSAGVTTVTDHIVNPLTVDAAAHLTAAAGATNIDYALSTGTFTSPSGTNTLSGHVAVASGKNFTMAGAGTTTTGTGAVALNGDVTVAAGKHLTMTTTGQFTTGTGAVAINGDVTIAATKGITKTAGAGNFDFSNGTGTFSTTSGTNTLYGNTVINGSKTFTTGTGAVAINGDQTIAADKSIVLAGVSTGTFDYSLSTGIFKTSTGTNTLGGNVAIAGSKTFDTGTGAVGLNGDVTVAKTKNLAASAAGGAGAGTFNWNTTGTFDTSTGTNSLNGNVVIAGSKTFDTGTGAIGLNGDITIAATKGITKTAGAGNMDFSAGTGTFLTTTGDNTLGGDTYIAANKDLTMGAAGGTGTGTFQTGTGAIALNGAITIAADKGIVLAGASTGNFDLSLSTGTTKTTTGEVTIGGNTTISGSKTFTTGTGAVTLNGDVTVAANKDIDMASGTGTFTTGTGNVTLNGNTTVAASTSLAVTTADYLTVGGVIVPQKVVITVPIHAATDATDKWVFIADAAYELLEIQEIHTVASTSGTINLYKSTSVQAPNAGATMLTGTMSTAGAANTVISGTRHGTEANRRLADGNTMSLVFTGDETNLVNAVVVITLKRV